MENRLRISEYICLAGVLMVLPSLKIKTAGYKTNRKTTSLACVFSRLKIFCLVCCACMVISEAKAQQASDYAVCANIMYHFTKYIDWPDNKKNGDFIIGIVGDTPLFEELKKIAANKTVGGRQIVVKKYAAAASSYHCHILFLCEDESDRLKKVMVTIENAPTLLVSESEGLAEKGSCINFVLINERLKLEINKSSIEQRGLNIANELLSLGKIVK